MRRFELTYGPKEFARFENQQDCVDDMVSRLHTIVRQEGHRDLRTFLFAHGQPGAQLESIRMVCIAEVV